MPYGLYNISIFFTTSQYSNVIIQSHMSYGNYFNIILHENDNDSYQKRRS